MSGKTFVGVLVFVSLVFSGCAGGSMSDRSEAPAASSPNVAPKSAAQVKPDSAGNSATTSPQVPTERKIVRNAELHLESGAPEETQRKVGAIAESKGGFVLESTQSSSDTRSRSRDTVAMVVRVPAAKFAESIDEIRKTADRVVLETVKSDDVTEEFIDVEARLKAKKSLEAQFLEIMKRANTVQEALDVQTKLSDVRAEIEKIEGRLKFLQSQTDFSTIRIRIQTPAAITGSSKGFFTRLVEAVGSGFDGALSFVLGFVTVVIAVLPFFVLIVLPIFLLFRYWFRKWRRQRAAAAILNEEAGESAT